MGILDLDGTSMLIHDGHLTATERRQLSQLVEELLNHMKQTQVRLRTLGSYTPILPRLRTELQRSLRVLSVEDPDKSCA